VVIGRSGWVIGALGLQPLLLVPPVAPLLAAEGLPQPSLVPAQVAVADVLPPDASPAIAMEAMATELRDLRLVYPLASPAEQIDPWGWRWSERRGAWRMHTGVDLAAAQGTAVLAARAGRVVLVESVGGYGLSVLIDHGQGLETLYAHLLDAAVAAGQAVEAGGVIGRLGMSGQATGPHLHFELRQRGGSAEAPLRALDPTPHLPPLLPPPPAPAAVATINP
jgi:murein DD-endopeptidase MepM/ murein hydrolase activator NlpD